MRTRSAGVLLVAVLGVAGCGSSGNSKQLADRELAQLVLQSSDLRGLVRFADGREISAEQSPALGRDPHRFGRQNGWVARYRRTRDLNANGPLIVASVAEAFSKSSGASDFFDRVKKLNETNAAGTLEQADGDDLGDERQVLESKPGRAGSVEYVVVLWRDGRFVGLVNASGYAGRMSTDNVLELARRQDRRLAAAG